MASTLFKFLLLLVVVPLRAQGPQKVLPCFPDEGPVAFFVEGVPVPEKAIERFSELLKARHPAMSEKTRQRKAIEEGIVPQAAVYALHLKHLPELSARAARVKERLDAGELFEKVSQDESDDPSRLKDSVVGTFSRTPGATVSLALEGPLFEAKEGVVIGPIVTAVGIQFVKVKKITPHEDARGEQREIAHILLHFSKDYGRLLRNWREGVEDPKVTADLQRLQAENVEAARTARVKVTNPKFRAMLYPYRIRKED